MKVSDAISQIRTDNKVEGTKKTSKSNEVSSAGTVPTDKVQLSSGSKDVQKMKEILNQTPEMRMEMIESLKQEINAGTYKVDSREIADRMLDDLLSSEILYQ